MLNARFALNAANARWGSLYDALYGTDVIPEDDGAEKGTSYNQVRGDKVIAYARDFLDEAVPLAAGSTPTSTGLQRRRDGAARGRDSATARRPAGRPGAVRRLHRRAGRPDWSVLLVHHGLHVEILIDPDSPIGSTDAAGIKDVVLESAITTIMDFEDSVAAVDADDKVLGYRNWLGLNRGDLAEEVTKDGKTFTRVAQRRPHLHRPGRRGRADPARPQPAVRPQRRPPDDHRRDRSTRDGNEVPEGILDALFTGLIAHARPRRPATRNGPLANSRTGSIYIVKPKMHGPDEVAFTVRAVQPRRGRARPAPGHPQGRHHGRGAAHHAQPQGLHQGRRATGSRSSTPASWTAPATRSTPRWRPARWSARAT